MLDIKKELLNAELEENNSKVNKAKVIGGILLAVAGICAIVKVARNRKKLDYDI